MFYVFNRKLTKVYKTSWEFRGKIMWPTTIYSRWQDFSICKIRWTVSELIPNGTSAQSGYTVPFTSVHAEK